MTEKPKETTTEDIKKMSIHEKLMNIKFELLECDIKKSGHNNYGGFDYHELRDILPPVNKLCYKYRCLTLVDFPDSETAILTLINADNKEDTISTHIPRPELKVLQRMNIMQSEGSYVQANNNSKQVKNKPKPACYDKIRAKCHELYPDEECDKKLLNKVSFNMVKSKELTPNEREEFYNYLYK